MSTIVISIDESISEVEGKYYGDNVCYDIVKRYADNFDHIILITRMHHILPGQIEKHHVNLPWNNINFVGVPFFNSIRELKNHYREIDHIVSRAVLGCDIALVRSPSLLGFMILRKCKKIPFALEVVANPYEMYKGYAGLRKVQALMMHFAQKHYCKMAVALAFVTKKSQQKIYERNKHKENNTYYSSIELKKDFFSDIPVKQDFFSNRDLPLRITHVANVIVGNIKGHKEVLEVAAKIKQLGKDVEVIFAGTGPDEDHYKKYAAELGIKATFMGFVDKQQLHNILQHSDFFLFPSKSEGLPKVLIEAMAVSVPCIASNVGGIPELLPPDNVFDSYDVDGMSNRIIELSSNKELYLENARFMYNTALEYESSVLAKRRVAFYHQLGSLKH